jgi:hypothetical protein
MLMFKVCPAGGPDNYRDGKVLVMLMFKVCPAGGPDNYRDGKVLVMFNV